MRSKVLPVKAVKWMCQAPSSLPGNDIRSACSPSYEPHSLHHLTPCTGHTLLCSFLISLSTTVMFARLTAPQSQSKSCESQKVANANRCYFAPSFTAQLTLANKASTVCFLYHHSEHRPAKGNGAAGHQSDQTIGAGYINFDCTRKWQL